MAQTTFKPINQLLAHYPPEPMPPPSEITSRGTSAPLITCRIHQTG